MLGITFSLAHIKRLLLYSISLLGEYKMQDMTHLIRSNRYLKTIFSVNH